MTNKLGIKEEWIGGRCVMAIMAVFTDSVGYWVVSTLEKNLSEVRAALSVGNRNTQAPIS